MYSSTHSLTPALGGGERSASRPGRFTPRDRSPGTHWIGGWVGPRAVLDAVARRKIPSPRRESNPRTPIVQPVAQRYTDWAITALINHSSKLYRMAYILIPPDKILHPIKEPFTCFMIFSVLTVRQNDKKMSWNGPQRYLFTWLLHLSIWIPVPCDHLFFLYSSFFISVSSLLSHFLCFAIYILSMVRLNSFGNLLLR
jgi:hypothetical protein